MERNKIIIKTSIMGIIVNIILVIFKAIVGLFTNSIAIILDAVNNLSDAISSIITIIGTKLSTKKPDKEHPYGHGRIEYIASVIIAAIVLFAGITSIKESFVKIISPEETNYTIVSLIIVSVAVIVKYIFGKYVKSVGKKIKSQSLIASGTDAYMDSILSFSTLVAAIISMTLNIGIEGYLGVIISIIIIKSSIEMLKDGLATIIGLRADRELTIKLKKIINSFKEVEGCYDITLHNYGPSEIIGSAHIQVNDDMKAKEIHMLSKKIQAKVYQELNITLTIGIYASNTSNEKFELIKNDLVKIVKKHKEILQLHGFFVDPESNIITFDLIFDFECKNEEEIKERVLNDIKEKYPDYEYFIVVDKDYAD
ncbi:MAG: cation transporter [Bacilli bacterium]|nr:cation transporter [Bacilli bacterium]